MRFLVLLCVFIVSASAWADDTAAARRVRVALALAGAAQCGECRFDEAGCRAEAMAAHKPLVLFVGTSCAKCGTAATGTGAVACVIESYAGDKLPPTTPRAVVLTPNPAGGWWLEGTVLGPTDAKVREAVEKAKPKPTGKVLSWDLR